MSSCRFGRVVLAVSLIVILAVASGSAVSPAEAQVGEARERATGPVIDFIAMQADGMPDIGLQASEVEVRINGRLRAVRSLRMTTAAPPPTTGGAPRSVVPAPYSTNAGVSVGRRFALVIDEGSLVAGREQIVRNAVAGLLEQLTPADRTLVVGLPFGGVKAPFTADVARIRNAMAGALVQGTNSETGSELACRTRRFLESLDGFLETQAGVESPLTVIVFTAGLAAPRRDAPMAHAPGMCELLPDHFSAITASAGAAHANFYVMQPADIGMTGAGWRDNVAGQSSLGSDNPLEGIEHLAGVTGGTRLPLDAGGTGSLLRVARETSAFWTAELVPASDDTAGRRQTLDVRVTRRGVVVRARPEIRFTDTRRLPPATRLTIPGLLMSRDAFTELPLRVGAFSLREPDGQLRVGIAVEPGDSGATLDSVGAILIEGDISVVARWFAADAASRPLLGAMLVPSGTYRLRVAAIDKAGRAGAAETEIEARLTAVGQLSLGSLLLGVSRPSGFVPQLEFGSEPVATATFDIYGGAGGEKLSATLDVALSISGPAIVTVPLALARASENRVVAIGAVPLGALPSGDYVIRGTIRLDDGTTGRVIRTLRKIKQ